MVVEGFNKMAVLGAGVMGHGIAQVAAASGYNVTVRDIAQEYLDSGEESIEKSLGRLVERERISENDMNLILGRIRFTINLKEAVEDANLIIEAVPEKMEIKKNVWEEVSEYVPDESICATNTSSLSITDISAVVSNPERFLGIHFFNPPVLMRLVELIPGEKTSQEIIEKCKKLVASMGKTPVAVKKDVAGFIVNRILITYLNEAAKLLDVYSKEQIDAAMHYNAEMPLGPFMLMDLIGIDITYDILKVFEEKLGQGYSPAKPIERLYHEKKLGRKTGEGFYSYEERPRLTQEQAEGFDIDLLMNLFRTEAEKVVNEGIATKESVNLALRLGANITNLPFQTNDEG